MIDILKGTKINRPNRNIKPRNHIHDDDMNILWNITSDLDVGTQYLVDIFIVVLN